jgi:hypothetical protein
LSIEEAVQRARDEERAILVVAREAVEAEAVTVRRRRELTLTLTLTLA